MNGDTARVLSIDARRVRFLTEHGEHIALARADPQLRHLDHAYSSTVHAAQGKTARSVIAALDSARLSDQTLLYVQMSRASDEFVLLTDDREALAETLLRRPGREEGALEAIGEALLAPPVVEPEVFEKLRADWAAVEMRARAAGDIAYFTQGYTEVMARAAALSAIEDLPADMRRSTETLLAEHKRHRARERTVTGFIRRMQSHWRRWTRLGRGSPDSPEEEAPAHRAWRADGGRMLGAARGWLEEESGIAPHLAAMPGARAGLETAVRDVERVRTRDDYVVFERRWRSTREKAAREGVPAIDVVGYEAIAAIGAALLHADTLDAAERKMVDAWKNAHDEATGARSRAERIRAWCLDAETILGEGYNLQTRARQEDRRPWFVEGYGEWHASLAPLVANLDSLADARASVAATGADFAGLIERFDVLAKRLHDALEYHLREEQTATRVKLYGELSREAREGYVEYYANTEGRNGREQVAYEVKVVQEHKFLRERAAELAQDLEWARPHLEADNITELQIRTYAEARHREAARTRVQGPDTDLSIG